MSRKTVVLLDRNVNNGLAANAAVHLAFQAGSLRPDVAGAAVLDGGGAEHSGIPIYGNVVLSIDHADLRQLVDEAYTVSRTNSELTVVGFPSLGQTTATRNFARR